MITASVYHGPDVRKACSHISRNVEWCFGHLAVRNCVEAFGTSQVASQSKSIEFRFFSKIKKDAESLNKSISTLKIFQEIVKLTNGQESVTIRNASSHRWTALVNVLEDMTKYDALINRACAQEGGVAKSSDLDVTQIVEFYSVLFPVSLAQKEAKKIKVFSQIP